MLWRRRPWSLRKPPVQRRTGPVDPHQQAIRWKVAPHSPRFPMLTAHLLSRQPSYMRKGHSCRRWRAAGLVVLRNFRTRTSSPFSPLPERSSTKSRCAFARHSSHHPRVSTGFVPASIARDQVMHVTCSLHADSIPLCRVSRPCLFSVSHDPHSSRLRRRA
jgi:hypothetical protein